MMRKPEYNSASLLLTETQLCAARDLCAFLYVPYNSGTRLRTKHTHPLDDLALVRATAYKPHESPQASSSFLSCHPGCPG